MFEAGENANESRFAGTIRAHESMDLAGANIEAHAVQRPHSAEGFVDIACRDEGRTFPFTRWLVHHRSLVQRFPAHRTDIDSIFPSPPQKRGRGWVRGSVRLHDFERDGDEMTPAY